MEQLIKVRAADEDVSVRLMDFSGLIGALPVVVPDHPYYRRAIADGDLVLVEQVDEQVDDQVDEQVDEHSEVGK